MKVCTDACLFGAWVADLLYNGALKAPNKIMDIGCGTGLLSLMLAQKINVPIDAIEIDAQAYLQATENVKSADFANHINTFHGPIDLFAANTPYDFIICNPPFYENQLKGISTTKNLAMHDDTLSLEKLAIALVNNLSVQGKAAILLPFDRMEAAEKIFSNQLLFVEHRVYVKHSLSKNNFRTMFILSYSPFKNFAPAEIIIKDDKDGYTSQFANLLQDYYLNM